MLAIFEEPTASPSNSTTNSWEDRMANALYVLSQRKSSQLDWLSIMTTKPEKSEGYFVDTATIVLLVGIAIAVFFVVLPIILK